MDALVFCDDCHSSEVKTRHQETASMVAEERARPSAGMELGRTDDRAPLSGEMRGIQSEVLIAEV